MNQKYIRISRLQCLIVSTLPLSNTKKFCKALIDTPIRFLITQNRLKNEEDKRVKLERDLEIFFKCF